MASVSANGLLALVDKPGGRTEYSWLDHGDDALRSTFTEFDAVTLEWMSGRGRCVMARRCVKRGELLMRVPALAHVAFSSVSSGDDSAQHQLDEYGLDPATIALSLSALRSEAGRQVVRSLSAARGEEKSAEVASRVRATHSVAPPLSLLPDRELGTLLLRVKCNLHVSHDAETACVPLGVGLYPAAAMLNHSCSPSVCFSWSEGGRYLNVRALVDVPEGRELCVSYLTDEQLYAPWEERRTLLREAFRFEPTEGAQRRAAETATVTGGGEASDTLRDAVQAAIARARRSLGGSAKAVHGALDGLTGLVERQLQGTLHPFHWLVQEAQSALLALARDPAVDEPRLIAQCTAHLISAREATLPVGTLHLAALYAAHGAALCRVLGNESASLSPSDAKDVLSAATRSLTAAQRIRDCCLGADHPLSLATGAAAQHAHEALRARG